MAYIKLNPDHPIVAELIGRTITDVTAVAESFRSGEIGKVKSLMLTLDSGRELELRGTDDYAEDPSLVIEPRNAGAPSREFAKITVVPAAS